MENYQTEDGMVVPEVLRKYIPGQPQFLPFVRELPKDTTSAKVKGKTEVAKKKINEGQGKAQVAPEGSTVDQLKDLKIDDKK